MAGPFDPASIHAAVKQAIAAADLPPGRSSVLAVVATKDGVSGVLAYKVNDHWQVDAIFSAQDQHVDGGVVVKASW